MPRIYRTFTLLICLAVLTSCGLTRSGSSSGGTDPSSPSDSSTNPSNSYLSSENIRNVFALPFSLTDSLNPFAAKSIANQALTPLVYDSLYMVSPTYFPAPLLAYSESAVDQTVTVTLKSGQYFSDGSLITARDIEYSFKLASVSPAYKSRLLKIESAQILNDSVIEFKFFVTNPYYKNILDFPVVKLDSAGVLPETATPKDYAASVNPDLTPTGSGRYLLRKQGETYTLTSNSRSTFGKSVRIPEVPLVNLPDSNSIVHNLEIGKISFAFQDLSTGEAKRINSTTGTADMNNLVFLGMNSKNRDLKNPAVRTALSCAVNRAEIVSLCFQTYATPVSIPFHPKFYALSEIEHAEPVFDTQKAIAKLTDAGFLKVDENGTQKDLAFNLIIPENNAFKKETANLIVQNLFLAGVDVEVVALSFDEYTARLQAGNFDLYLGEIRLASDMSLLPFFEKNGAARYGVDPAGISAKSYQDFLTGVKTLRQFISDFDADLPILPLCYRTALTAYSRNLTGNILSTVTSNYYNIEDWEFIS